MWNLTPVFQLSCALYIINSLLVRCNCHLRHRFKPIPVFNYIGFIYDWKYLRLISHVELAYRYKGKIQWSLDFIICRDNISLHNSFFFILPQYKSVSLSTTHMHTTRTSSLRFPKEVEMTFLRLFQVGMVYLLPWIIIFRNSSSPIEVVIVYESSFGIHANSSWSITFNLLLIRNVSRSTFNNKRQPIFHYLQMTYAGLEDCLMHQ